MPRTKTSKLDTPELGAPKLKARETSFKTIPFDATGTTKLVIDQKTTIYVPAGRNVEKVRQKWLLILAKQQKMGRLKEYVPVK